MAALTTAIALAGLGLAAGGTAMTFYGQHKAAESQKDIINVQLQEEQQRKAAMELDATRRKRQMVREAIAARSQALAISTASGTAQSSPLQGAYSQIAGQTAVNEQGVNQNLQIGENLFGLKAQETALSKNVASSTSLANTGTGLASLGNGFIQNLKQINSVGTYLGSWFSNTNNPNWGGFNTVNNSGYY
jgi:hypothetical protein